MNEPIFCKNDDEVNWLIWLLSWVAAIFLGSIGLVKRPDLDEKVDEYWENDDYVGPAQWDGYEYRPHDIHADAKRKRTGVY